MSSSSSSSVLVFPPGDVLQLPAGGKSNLKHWKLVLQDAIYGDHRRVLVATSILKGKPSELPQLSARPPAHVPVEGDYETPREYSKEAARYADILAKYQNSEKLRNEVVANNATTCAYLITSISKDFYRSMLAARTEAKPTSKGVGEAAGAITGRGSPRTVLEPRRTKASSSTSTETTSHTAAPSVACKATKAPKTPLRGSHRYLTVLCKPSNTKNDLRVSSQLNTTRRITISRRRQRTPTMSTSTTATLTSTLHPPRPTR